MPPVIHEPDLGDSDLVELRRLGRGLGQALEQGKVLSEARLAALGRRLWATGLDFDAGSSGRGAVANRCRSSS